MTDKAEELLKKGKSSGFVTQDEILALFPRAEDHLLELDEFYDRLINANVDIFETTAADLTEEIKSVSALEEDVPT